MNALPRVYEPPHAAEAPLRLWRVPSWLVVPCAVAGSIVAPLWVGLVVTRDARDAAMECRRAAEELRHEREMSERDRQLNEAARRDFAAKAVGLILKAEGKDHGDEH